MRDAHPVQLTFAPALEARLDACFLGRGMGLNTHLLRQERREILLWLNAKSDAELALMGLARRDIPAFVFRDLLSG